MSVTATISLIMLLVIFIICTWKNKNPGLLGVAIAFILGFFVHNAKGVLISSRAGGGRDIIAGFPIAVFLNFVFICMLFNIARDNGTLEKLVFKFMRLIKGNSKIIPIMVFLILAVVGYFGGAGIPLLILMCGIVASICEETGLDYFKIMACGYCGQLAGLNSRMSVMGLVTIQYAEASGYDIGHTLAYTTLLWCFLSFVVMYIIFGCWKWKKMPMESLDVQAKFTREQVITLIGLIVFSALALFGFSTSLSAILVAIFLCYVNKVDEKKIVDMVPWSVMMMVGCMGMFIATLQAAGGIELISNFLLNYVNEQTVAPLMSVAGSVLGAVSSATGVVMPTLIPMAISICEAANLNPIIPICAITLGCSWTGICPLATAGATILAYQHGYESAKLFGKLMIHGIIWGIIMAIIAALPFAYIIVP
jgi:di/tricarboxylate transporter